MEEIKIQEARIHNLKNISLTIPKHKLVVITGISGSGKSSLAFDTLFEEGKNKYLRSIGILAGLDNEDRFDRIEGIGPTVAVRQNTIRQSNPRSTVGTKISILTSWRCYMLVREKLWMSIVNIFLQVFFYIQR